MIKEVYSEKETRDFAYEMAQKAEVGQVYCLDGDLGVGKTVFTKGFAEGLGIDDDITSPTFTIVNEYHSGRIPFYHFDVYRIGDEDESAGQVIHGNRAHSRHKTTLDSRVRSGLYGVEKTAQVTGAVCLASIIVQA